MYVAFARRHPAVGEVLLSELPMSSDDLNSLDFLIFHQVGEWERQHGELRTVLHLRARTHLAVPSHCERREKKADVFKQ